MTFRLHFFHYGFLGLCIMCENLMLSQSGLPQTSFYALGVYVGLAVRADMPLTLRLSHSTWRRILSPQVTALQGIDASFVAFRAGLSAVVPIDALCLLWEPEEVERVICGDDAIDFALLKSVTAYEGVSDEGC